MMFRLTPMFAAWDNAPEITLAKPRFTIGRAEDCDLRLQGCWVSRRHCLLIENMRMTPHELLADCRCYISEVEQAGFLRDAGMEYDLKQQITELMSEFTDGIAFDGIGDFIRLLDRIRCDRVEALGNIPGATGLRIPQSPHHFKQFRNRSCITLFHIVFL